MKNPFEIFKKEKPERERQWDQELHRVKKLLEMHMPHDLAKSTLDKLESISRKVDEQVKEIFADPNIQRDYDLENYDGFGLDGNVMGMSVSTRLHDGLTKLKSLNDNNISIFFNSMSVKDVNADVQNLVNWFGDDIEINNLRIKSLKEAGTMIITDPSKVRTKLSKDFESETTH